MLVLCERSVDLVIHVKKSNYCVWHVNWHCPRVGTVVLFIAPHSGSVLGFACVRPISAKRNLASR